MIKRIYMTRTSMKGRRENYSELYRADLALGIPDEIKFDRPTAVKILKNRNAPPGKTYMLTLNKSRGKLQHADYDHAMKIVENK